MKEAKKNAECCRIEAVVSVDERGQLVIPKEIREKAGLNAGTKLALALVGKNDEVCCIVLTKLELLNEPVSSLLGISKGGSK